MEKTKCHLSPNMSRISGSKNIVNMGLQDFKVQSNIFVIIQKQIILYVG